MNAVKPMQYPDMPEVAMANVTENREEWLKMRKDTIGSSDITTIAGLNTFCSPLELWVRKTGKVEIEDIESPAMVYGRMVEPAIRKMFTMAKPEFKLYANDDTYKCKEHPWATATPDSFAELQEDHTTEYDLAGNPWGLNELKHTGYPIGWDEGAPNYAHCQLIWQLGIMKLDWGFVTGVVAGKVNDTKTPFFRFEKPIFEQLVGLAINFRECVAKDLPPQAGPGDKKLIDRLIEKRDGEIELSSVGVTQWVNQYVAEKKELKELNAAVRKHKGLQDEAINNLKMEMGKAKHAVLDDGREITLKKVNRAGYTAQPSSYWNFKIK